MQWTHRIFLTKAKLKLKPAGMNSNSLVSASQMKRFFDVGVFWTTRDVWIWQLGRFSQMNWWLLSAAALTRVQTDSRSKRTDPACVHGLLLQSRPWRDSLNSWASTVKSNASQSCRGRRYLTSMLVWELSSGDSRWKEQLSHPRGYVEG